MRGKMCDITVLVQKDDAKKVQENKTLRFVIM